MSEFKTTLEVRLLPESESAIWQLTKPLVYYSDVMNCLITVPEGFVTDFVSFEPLKNIGQRPAVVHDFLYSCLDVDREVADKVLCEALKYCGVHDELADSMFIAVRVFGGGHKDNLYSFYGGAS